MFFWFVGGACMCAWIVFRDPRFKFQALSLGALFPDFLLLLNVSAYVTHSIVLNVAILFAGMLITILMRSARKWFVAFCMGSLFHLLLDGAWSDRSTFWWPLLSSSGKENWPVLDRPIVLNLMLELLGIASLLYLYGKLKLRSSSVILDHLTTES